MKFMKALAVILMVVAVFSTLSFAKAPKSAITASQHDLRAGIKGIGTGNQWSAGSYTLCSFCHVAHKPGNPLLSDPVSGNLAPAKAGPLLWAHQFSTVASYGVYTSDSFAGYGTDIADLGTGNTGSTTTVSNLCLSCHDGTVAVDSFYEAIGNSSFSGNIAEGTTKLGTTNSDVIFDMTQQHPVNFTYNAGLATAAGLLTPASATSVDGKGEVPLFSGKMQCATCHDPHNGASGIFEQAGFPTQTSGSFCTYCHL